MKQKFIIVAIAFLTMVFTVANAQRGQRRPRKQDNIQGITLSAYTLAEAGTDSIRLLTYIIVPNRALQFLKKEGTFIANFDTFLSLKNEEGDQIASRIWSNSVIAENYVATTAKAITYVHFHEFHVIPGEYTLVTEILDKDTNQSGIKEKKLKLKKYSEKEVLYTPFFLDYLDGEWGLKTNEIPLFSNKVHVSGIRTSVFISGKVAPGDFTLDVEVRNEKKAILWNQSFQLYTDSGVFEQRVIIPKEVTLKGLRQKVNITLKQGNVKKKESLNLSILKTGVSHSIENIVQAVEHMRYILYSDEWKNLSKADNEEQEALFLEYWDKRDPTPHTSVNELMDEYFNRIYYTNQNFKSYQPGWKTDLGMIYILFGPPDDIEVYNNVSSRVYSQRWHYYRINRSFDFIDENGFGDYRLATPFYQGRNR